MSTIGNKAATQHVSLQKQTITGNGGTSYSLQQSVGSALDIAVFVNNTRQEPTVAYSASGTTLTMTGAVNSSDHFYVIFLGKSITTTGLPVDAVGTDNINANAVTTAKLHDDAVTSAKLPSGTVLQMPFTQYTSATTQSITGQTSTAITVLTVNITPKSTSSIIRLDSNIMFEWGVASNTYSGMWFFYRDTTKLAHTQTGSRLCGISTSLSSHSASDDDSTPEMGIVTYFDSPSTTSQITYKLGVECYSTDTLHINRTVGDTDNKSFERGVSFISATEIAG
mgnify:CR=1 FL=1